MQRALRYAERMLALFTQGNEFKPHFDSAQGLIDPHYESERVPDAKENFNLAFRALTRGLHPQRVELLIKLITAAFCLGKRAGMSQMDDRGAVWYDDDPARPQWCQGEFHESMKRSLNSSSTPTSS